MKKRIRSANPYLPLWEHIPDGEPRLFTYNGERRLYIYGSHDTEVTAYCGRDYVVWSAPEDDLTDWTCHGTCYRAAGGSVLYAPDVVCKDGVYYMYAAEYCGDKVYVAKSDKPWGPFTDPKLTELGFDPGVLVDDDGRTYAFWGFCDSHACELDDDMASIRPGTHVYNLLDHAGAPWIHEKEHLNETEGFYEASSPRKILGKYVLVYSKKYGKPLPELGVYHENNGFLSYKWSENPLGPYHEGGDISFNGGEIIFSDESDRKHGTMTYQWGNNHGSLVRVKDKWYVFYHRQTGTDEFARQGMCEPVDIAEDRNGRIFIGKINYEDGEPVSSEPVEMTSQGVLTGGLDACSLIPAAYACHIYDGTGDYYSCSDYAHSASIVHPHLVPVYTPESRANISSSYTGHLFFENEDDIQAPVVGIKNGTVVGFRYLDFGEKGPESVSLTVNPVSAGWKIRVRLDAYVGKIIGEINMETACNSPVNEEITGRHAVYFEFLNEDPQAELEFLEFTFDKDQ